MAIKADVRIAWLASNSFDEELFIARAGNGVPNQRKWCVIL